MKDTSIQLADSNELLCGLCIKKFKLEFCYVSKDYIQIFDKSIFYGEPGTPVTGQYEIFVGYETTNPTKSIFINAGGCTMIDLRSVDFNCLRDGAYCVRTISCGRPISIEVPYFPTLECTVDNLLLKDPENDDFQSMADDIDMAKKAVKYQMFDQAIILYQSIEKRVKKCNGKMCQMY